MHMLKEKKIQIRPIWYLNNLQKPYKNNHAYKIEKANYYLKNVLNIPCSFNLGYEDVKYVIETIKNIKR